MTEILVTTGAYEALYVAIQGHTSPGDEWIIIEPFFDCYAPMVRMAGGVPKYIALQPVSIFLISHNLTKLNKKQLNKLKMIFHLKIEKNNWSYKFCRLGLG